MTHDELSRRGFFQTTVAGAVGLSAAQTALAREPQPQPSDDLKDLNKAENLAPATQDNIEGPFYRPHAPFQTKLAKSGDKGDVVIVSGSIVSQNGEPIEGAVLDVWHASMFGQYDNEDPLNPPDNDKFHYRGRIKTGPQGEYSFQTIRPGGYKIGPTQYRAAHIHLKLYHNNYQMLVSQLFFQGDKHGPLDPWFKPSMALDLKRDHGKVFRANFKFVLADA